MVVKKPQPTSSGNHPVGIGVGVGVSGSGGGGGGSMQQHRANIGKLPAPMAPPSVTAVAVAAAAAVAAHQVNHHVVVGGGSGSNGGGSSGVVGNVGIVGGTAPDARAKQVLKEAVDAVVNSFAKHTQGYGRGK